MKRFRRTLFNTLTAISLLLAIATAALWVRSYWRQDCMALGRFSMCVGRGFSIFTWASASNYMDSKPHWESDPDLTSYQRLPWFHFRAMGLPTRRVYQLEFPLWLVLGIAIGAHITLNRSTRTLLPGLCPACGYDMRANPAKCSECGHEPSPTTT